MFKYKKKINELKEKELRERKVKEDKYKKRLKNLLSEIDRLAEGDRNESLRNIQLLIKQVTSYLTYSSAMESYTDSNLNVVFSLQSIFEGQNLGCKEDINRVLYKKPVEGDIQIYKKFGYKWNNKILIKNIDDEAVVFNPWNFKRISENIEKVGTKKNPFDSIRYKNVENNYYFPIGVILSTAGNHSQYVAKLKRNNQTHIREVVDLRELYKKIKFDGYKFIYELEPLEEDVFLELEVKNEVEYYAGVLFEIGRKLMEKSIYDLEVKKIIDEALEL